MSTPALLPDAELSGVLPVPVAGQSRLSGRVARHLMSGTSTLGAGIAIERGLGFLANILAARFAGAGTFGAYSLALTTANNISTYAAGGIGATATRFSGKYPYKSAGYTTLARVLCFVSLVSAVVASAAIWLGAAPIAHLLHKPGLSSLLRWAALSAAGMILLECARGFFVGQRRLVALLMLSLIVGVGMISLLPVAASSHQPTRMIVSQGAILCAAVILCVLLARPLGLSRARRDEHPEAFRPMLREVWSFGGIQLAGLIGANVSGWWLTALVARSDTTLVQMSFFAIASQLRNLAGLAPGLLTEGSYAVMADPSEEHLRTPQRVMALCTFASSSVALVFAAFGMIAVPWVLPRLYGPSYQGASLTAALGLAIAVVHMGNAPAAARLSIVSIRATGMINTFWALLVAGLATMLLLHKGNAAIGLTIFLVAHLVSAALVLLVLHRTDHVPAGMDKQFALSGLTVVALVLGAYLRSRNPAQTFAISALMAFVLLACVAILLFMAKQHGWLPTRAALRQLAQKFSAKLQSFSGSSKEALHGK